MTVKWMMHVPVISTGHLTEESANIEITPDFEGPGYLYVIPTQSGFMVYGGEDALETPEIPDDLRSALEWALERGYDWVRFDEDGDRIEELPWYEW